MGIENKTFDKIKTELFKEIKENCLRMCFIFFDFEDDKDTLVVTPELIPAPSIELWPDLFNKVVDEVYSDIHNIPDYISMVNIIKFSKHAHSPDLNEEEMDKELMRNSVNGYFVIMAEVNTGDIECRLYKDDFSLEKGSIKKLNAFDIKSIGGFPPALMMLGIIARFLSNGISDDSDTLPDVKAGTRRIGFKISKTDNNSVYIDTVFPDSEDDNGESKGEESSSDSVPPLYNPN